MVYYSRLAALLALIVLSDYIKNYYMVCLHFSVDIGLQLSPFLSLLSLSPPPLNNLCMYL